jgi:MFS transporter, DHA1 family, multidrug resistance protein
MVLIVGSLTAFGPLSIDSYLPALPSISNALDASPSMVQLSLTSCLVGLAVGQLLAGPASDRWGRRPPLMVGIAAFVVASLCCAAAGSVWVLIALRMVQGLGGSAGIVISRAIVRDCFSGPTAARFFSLLMMVTGTGPMIAPQIGAQLLQLGSWRTVFAALAVAGLLLLVVAAVWLPETRHPSERPVARVRGDTWASLRSVATHRVFLPTALACGLGYGSIFAYVGGSSFALETSYDLSPQVFGLIFGINGIGLIVASQLNARLVPTLGSARLLTSGLVGLAGGGVTLLAAALTHAPLAATLVSLFVVVCSNGFVAPNAMAMAMEDFPESSGSAAALVGVLQFAIGGVTAPLVGLGGPRDGLAMAVVMATCGTLALALRLVITSPRRAFLWEPPTCPDEPTAPA